MSVTLRTRENKDGTTSFRLDIYHNKRRWPETIPHIKLTTNPKNKKEREQNKANFELAEQCARERERQLTANDYSVQTDLGKKVIVVVWMQAYIDKYQNADKRSLQAALNKFILFLKSIRQEKISFAGLSEIIVADYQDYLRREHKGETPSSYFSRFKRMLRRAHREKLIAVNPGDFVPVRKGIARRKDTLTLEEIKKVYNTPTQSQSVKRAFLFSCFTGLAWVDVKQLKWENIRLQIEESKGVLSKPRSKNGQEIYINLNETAIALLSSPGKDNELVFKLPSADGANKTIRSLVKRAGISKKITWHNARHSFGTNLVFKKVGILTASKLMGHASTKHTTRYIDMAAQQQEEATNTLNIDLDEPQNNLKAVI